MKRFTILRLFTAVYALLLTSACIQTANAPRPTPLLLLVSIDAFRWDYCELYPEQTPTLSQLKREGVSAQGLIPVYPSNTFPNHYTVVTGLYPSNHGIINNHFYDASSGAFFRSNVNATVTESRWWGGEPLWVTAQNQGVRSAVSFWPGSEAEIKGVRPNFWRTFQLNAPFEQRLAEFSRWLALPPPERPGVIAFYLEEVNAIGHRFGPNSAELAKTIHMLDQQLGRLLGTIESAGLEANVVVVSDHGMTPISTERVILLDDFISPDDVQLDFEGPAAGLRPLKGSVAALLERLSGLEHARAYRVEDLPERFHIDPANPRNPPVWIVPEEGWEIYFSARFNSWRNRFNKGDHGYDPAFPNMHGVLIAHGPAFRDDGSVVPSVDAVHVYNLLCAARGLTPAPNDGDDRLVRAMMKPAARSSRR